MRVHSSDVVVKFELGKVARRFTARLGLKLPSGWIYAQGVTHYELDEHGRLLMAGHDGEGESCRGITLEISKHRPLTKEG